MARIMVKIGILMVIGLATVNIALATSHLDKLTISPSQAEVFKFVNDSYIVSCSSNHKDGKLKWLSPKGAPIASHRGRLHIEEKSAKTATLALVFEYLALADKGNWTCVTDGEEVTRSFRMIIHERISFMDTPVVQVANETRDATILCEVRGDPEPAISWYFNGNPIIPGQAKYTKLADGLHIKKTSRNDSGEYTCKAFQISSYVSNVQEKTIRLNIQHKPILPTTARVDMAFGYLEGSVNLTCEVEAEPPATFTWFRHNKKVNSKNIMTDENVSMMLVKINATSVFGEYKCRATNIFGNVEHVINLQEGTKPDPPSKFHLRGVNFDTLDIDVGITKPKARSPMDVCGYRFQYISVEDFVVELKRWNKAKQVDFKYESDATYLLTHLTPNTTYLVRVATRNPAGSSDWTEVKEYTTHPYHTINTLTSGASPTIAVRISSILIIALLML